MDDKCNVETCSTVGKIQLENDRLRNALKKGLESSLRPATKYLNATPDQQFVHVCSEVEEVRTEWEKFVMYRKDGFFNEKLAEELVDLQMSAETMLAVLGLDERDREGVRKMVIAKNAARGYYNAV